MGGQRVPSCPGAGRAQNEGSLWGPTLSFLSLGVERATRDSLIQSRLFAYEFSHELKFLKLLYCSVC